MTLLMLLAVPLVFYFLLIRPQSKRRKEQLNMQSSVEPGAKVITTAGMHATVVEVDDDGVLLEIAPGVQARFLKQAVMQVVKDDVADDEIDDDDVAEDGEPAGERVELTKDDAKDAAGEAPEPVSTAKAADKPSA
ncbi:preprotein translocase subunit YajC [Actinomadura macrotermitis]|nr:preprotein translocase subunit YajC [Actinomadura macrotermitis]